MRIDIRGRIGRVVRGQVRKRGYEIKKRGPIDIRTREHPVAATLRAASMTRVTMVSEVALKRCRAETGLTVDDRHPFVATLKRGPLTGFGGSVLSLYYEGFQPITALEVLGVDGDEAPGFVGLPATAYVVPWHGVTPSAALDRRRRWMQSEAEAWGRALTLDDGVSLFGPVSPEKGALEIERLKGIYGSIRQDGYQRSNEAGGDVEGWILTRAEGDWCFLIRAGQHRSAAAAAAGITRIPIRLRHAAVKREDVMYWPQVSRGLIKPEAALRVFDRYMRGENSEADTFSDRAIG